MGTVQAIPKDDSYVNEWEALQVSSAGDFGLIRRMIKNTPWVAQMVLERDDTIMFAFTQIHPTGMEQWTSFVGDWIVKSPSGKFWFMSDTEFHSQFVWKP